MPDRSSAQPTVASRAEEPGRMTLAEKLAQLGGAWATRLLDADGNLDESLAASRIGDGIGQLTRISGDTALLPAGAARVANDIQRFLIERTRLGIPAIVHEESTGGFLARGATQFPQAIGLAATWDPDGVETAAEVISAQLRAVGARQTLAPVLDIARDPRWGRVEETYGEDPYLTSRMGVAYVRGIQGNDLARGVVATAKHFLGYGYGEGGMNHAPAHIGPRELREVVAAPFRAVVNEAGVASIMNSYGSIDGIPCGGSAAILDDLLRRELGFDGTVVSDYWTLPLLETHHAVAASRGDAGRIALAAGIDVELPALSSLGKHLAPLIESGEVDVALVDRAVRRVLEQKLALGLFEEPYVEVDAAPSVFDTPAQRALARRLAAESIVLLRNEGGVLPLDAATVGRLALVGPCADDIRLHLGDYHYPAHLEVAGAGTTPVPDLAPTSGALRPGAHYVPMESIAAAVRGLVGDTVAVALERGCGVTGDADEDDLASAVAAARDADVAIVCVGGKSGLTTDCTSGEMVDATDLGLTGAQQRLVEEVVATGTTTVVVLVGGRVFALPWIAEHVPALVECWLPGEEGGPAVADVLFGITEPSGRLPISMPRHVGQVPIYHGHHAGGGKSQMHGEYSDSPTTPLFAFGHGLGYTTWHYNDLVVDITDGSLHAQVSVVNTGARHGTEVVQLYVRDVVASVVRPVRQLVGFTRVEADAGRLVTVDFDVDPGQLAFYDERMRVVLEPGEVEVMIGASSADIRQRATVTIAGPARTVDLNTVRPTTASVRA